jgi:hypothetical protein
VAQDAGGGQSGRLAKLIKELMNVEPTDLIWMNGDFVA